jgi:4-amino-4-deoxy-L-arabinose transferase-like glycosyltransferase
VRVSVKHKPILLEALAYLGVAGLAWLLFINAMNKGPSRDEQMYCTAGVLLAQEQAIYKDFSYVSQLPYHPALLSVAYQLTGTTQYLLVARLLSWACEAGILLLILAIYRHLFGCHKTMGTLLGLGAAVLYALNPIVFLANGYAWNHPFILLAVMLSLWLVLQQLPNSLVSGLIQGAILTFACGMRITTVLIWGLFLLYWIVNQTDTKQKKQQGILGFFVGTGLLAIWPIYTLLQAPQAAWANLLIIPKHYGQWHLTHGTAHNKLDLTLMCLTAIGYLALLICWGITTWMGRTCSRAESLTPDKRQQLLLWIVATFVVIAFIPPTMWQQYWAAPVPFIVMCLAIPLHRLQQHKTSHSRLWRTAITALILSTALAAWAMTFTLMSEPLSLSRSQWPPLQMHALAQDIAKHVKAPKRILTLAPLLALEGDAQIYRELSCGSVVYRIGDQLPAQIQTSAHVAGFKSLKQILADTPVDAILVGTESGLLKGLDQGLIDYVPENWSKINYPSNITLYYRP